MDILIIFTANRRTNRHLRNEKIVRKTDVGREINVRVVRCPQKRQDPFGVLTDVQYADIDDCLFESKNRYYRNSLILVSAAVADW